jgi:hypothetical protein
MKNIKSNYRKSFTKAIYIVLLAVNNCIAIIFFRIAFLNIMSKNSAVVTYLSLILYGFIVSLFFSIISFIIVYRIRRLDIANNFSIFNL